jgi:cell division protein FtsZ
VRATEPASRPMTARPAAASAAEGRAPNLFQRITGAFATPKGLTPVVAGPVATAPAAAEPAPAPRAAPAPENVVAVAPAPRMAPAAPAPRPVSHQAPVQTSISLDVNERARPARDDDDLQIPAFLRRQAN